MFRKIWLLMTFFVVVLCACGGGSDSDDQSAQGETACQRLINEALARIETSCDNLSRNEACYGNRLIEADLSSGSEARFSEAGDTVNLAVVETLRTAPLDEAGGTWGVAVIKAQVDLPDTVPGQLVTFVLLGDTNLSGVDERMSSFSLSTGVGETNCAALPAEPLIVQSPTGTPITLTINGASITMGSTLYISAAPNGEMRVATIEGSASVTAQQVTQTVLPGALTRIPLGGANGLQAAGPPSPPEPFDSVLAQALPLSLLERAVTVPQPIAVPTATDTPTLTITPQPQPSPTDTPTPTPSPTPQPTEVP